MIACEPGPGRDQVLRRGCERGMNTASQGGNLLQAVAPGRQHVPGYLAAQHNRVGRLVLGQPA
jgi:hypothetical protein